MKRTTLRVGGVSLNAVAESVETLESGWVRLVGETVQVSVQDAYERFFRHGWHSWSLAHWADLGSDPFQILVPDLQRQADDPRLGGVEGHVGSWVGVIESSEGPSLLLGALGLDAHVEADESSLSGRSTQLIDWVVGVGDSQSLLSEYAKSLADVFGRREVSPAPRIWCSWNSHGWDIDEARMQALASTVAREPFDVFLVDDGWQQDIGDWSANDSFPSGMADLAAHISSEGLTPGLWLSPFAVRDSMAQRVSDLLVRDDDGEPHVMGHNWQSQYHGLDLAKPEAVEFAAASVARAVSWGYRVLKLDFLFAGAVNPAHPSPEAAYRSAVEQIREAAGEDVWLIACGAPIVPSIGVFDSIRVGPDVAPYWQNPLDRYVQDYSAPGMRIAISTSLSRLWLRSAIDSDPDMSYFSSVQNLLTEDQRRMQRNLAQIFGVKSSSARVGDLTDEELSELRAFFESSPPVEQVDRYRFAVNGHEVDFSPVTMDGVARLS